MQTAQPNPTQTREIDPDDLINSTAMGVWGAFGDGIREGLKGDPGKLGEPAPSALPAEETAPSTSPPVEPAQTPTADRPVNKSVLTVVAVIGVLLLLIALVVITYNKGKSATPTTEDAESRTGWFRASTLTPFVCEC